MGRVFVLVLALVSVAQAASALKLFDLGLSRPAEEFKQLDHIDPLVLEPYIRSGGLSTLGTTIWRFSAELHEDVVAHLQGTNFTAIFAFPRDENKKFSYFAARPRTLLTEDAAWYTDLSDRSISRVYAALRIPEKRPGVVNSSLPSIVIDVECRGCQEKNVTVTFGPERAEWSSVKKNQIFNDFSARAPYEREVLAAASKISCAEGLNCWEFNSTAVSLCSGAFDGAIQFYVDPATIRGNLYWRLSTREGAVTEYEAEVGVDGHDHIVRWGPHDQEELCKDPYADISLQVTCEECKVRRAAVSVPNEPEIPHGASPEIVAHLSTTWQDGGICSIDVAASPSSLPTVLGNDDILRLWFDDSASDCKQRYTSVDEASLNFTLGWIEERRIRQWEKELARSPMSLGRSFSGISKCLCEQLKGRVYRLIDWWNDEEEGGAEDRLVIAEETGKPYAAPFKGRVSAGPVTDIKPVDNLNIDGKLLEPIAEEQVIEARKDQANDLLWYLAANISAAAIRSAKRYVVATFKLTADGKGKIFSVSSPLRTTGRLATPYFDARKQTVEVTIKPQRASHEGVVANIDEALSLQLYCADCTVVHSTVQFRFGRALTDIEPQPLLSMGLPQLVEGLYILRLFTVVHEDILLRGGGTKFTAVFEFPTVMESFKNHFVARPLSLLTKEKAWYTEFSASSKSHLVYAALQLPDAWNKTDPPKVVIDIACAERDMTKARLTYQPEPPEWSSISKRQIYDLFVAREGKRVKTLKAITKKQGIEGMNCWEISTINDNLCSDTFDGAILFYVDPKTISGSISWSLRAREDGTVTSFKAVVGVHDSYHHTVSWKPEDRRFICAVPETEISVQLTCEGCVVVDPVVRTPLNPEVPQEAILDDSRNITPKFWDTLGVCNIDVYGSETIKASHSTILRIWPSLEHGCMRKVSEISSSSPHSKWAQDHNLQNWAMELSSRPVRLGRAFSGFSKCDCERLTGAVYSVVEWKPTGHEKKRGNHDFFSTNHHGTIQTATGETEYASGFAVDRSLEYEQEVNVLNDSTEKNFWRLVANISIPQIQCAKTHVTATFTLIGDTKKIVAVSTPFSSTGRWNTPHYDSVNDVVKVTLKPQLSSRGECASQLHEALPLEVNCRDCATIHSVVKFTLGRVIEDIDPQPLSSMCHRKVSPSRPPTWRFFAVVDKEILARGKGTQFSAVFNFPVRKRPVTLSRFAARPRTFLSADNAWYTQRDPHSGSMVVYAALEVPDYGEGSSHNSKTIIIDVECDGCDTQNAFLTYQSKAAEWKTIKKRQIYYDFWARAPFNTLQSMEKNENILCNEKSICREFTAKAKIFCGGTFDAAVSLSVAPRYAKPHFYWTVSRMNMTDYQAEVGTDGLGKYLVRWSATDGRRICRDPNAVLSLHLICDDCTASPVELYEPSVPEVPHGASPHIIAEIAGSGDRGGNCQIKALETGPTTAMPGDIPRLWSEASDTCHSSNSNPKFLDKRLDWLTKQKVRNWETWLAKSPKTLALWVPNVSKCACEGIKGNVYRGVDWGQVTPENEQDDDAFCSEDEAAIAAESKPSARPDETGTNKQQEQTVNGKPRRTTAKFAALYAKMKSPTRRVGHSKQQEASSDDNSTSLRTVNSENNVYEDDVLPNPELDNSENIESDDSIDESAIPSWLLDTFCNNTAGRQQGNRMVFDSLVRIKEMKPTVPFVASFCLLTGKSASITSVTFWKGPSIENFPGPDNSTILCYAYDSCDAWEALATVANEEDLPSLEVVVTGVNLPRKMIWRIDSAVEVKGYPSNGQGTTVSRAGWYGTAAQLSKYKKASNLVEVNVEPSLMSRCYPTPDVDLVYGVKEAKKDVQSNAASIVPNVETSFVYVRPKFQLIPKDNMAFGGDWQILGASALIPALALTIIALVRYDQP